MVPSQSVVILLLLLQHLCFGSTAAAESTSVTVTTDEDTSKKISIVEFPDTELIHDDDDDHSLERTVVISPLPYQYIDPSDLPTNFDWRRVVDGGLTRSLNQHIPQ